MSVVDEKQDSAAEWLVHTLKDTAANSHALLGLAGAVGSGKTNVMRRVAKRLPDFGLFPLYISAPSDEVDCAAIALLETASQLESSGLANGALEVVRDPRSRWAQKMDAVTTTINKHCNDVVILCDEPRRWYRRHQSDLDETPDYAARSLAEWIAKEATCRRLISGAIPDDTPTVERGMAPRLTDGREILANGFSWGPLEGPAWDLHSRLTSEVLGRSVWDMRLCVALCLLKPVEEIARVVKSQASSDSLVRELLDLVEVSPGYVAFCNALARLTVARTGLPKVVIAEILQELPVVQQSVIEDCLMDWEEDSGSLHPLVRHEVMTRPRVPRRWETHQRWRLSKKDRLAVHKRLVSEYPTHDEAHLRNALESLHHEVLGQEVDVLDSDKRLLFVEQLHEIGRSLSHTHKEHARAIEVFRLALRMDPQHPYSHHYLAFNLDWLAQNAEEVEDHYQRAIFLQPTHPWWWSRWITYLATRGRFRESKVQWRAAMDALSIGEDSSSDRMFRSLHRWVARWLLHWGELDFAEEVLQSIPGELTATDTSIQTLWELLEALRRAEYGVCVFPLTVPASSWWSPTPHTELPLTQNDCLLQNFLPARVEHIDEETGMVFLLAAKRPSNCGGKPEYVDIELSQKDIARDAHNFDWCDLSEGRFLEIGYYVGGGRRIALHRETVWRDPDLLPLMPPPDRWFRRATEATWATNEEEE